MGNGISYQLHKRTKVMERKEDDIYIRRVEIRRKNKKKRFLDVEDKGLEEQRRLVQD